VKRWFYHYVVSWADTYMLHGTNYPEGTLLKEIVIPFVSKQTKLVFLRKGEEVLNFGNASALRVFKTENPLSRDEISKFEDTLRIGETCTAEIIDKIRLDSSVTESKSLILLSTNPPKKQIFVIMPFGDKELDSNYEVSIKPLQEKFGYKVFRIDDIQDSGLITNQILNSIAESEIIISELTKERPNCYYETGIAQALGKELILIIRKSESKHFDISGYRFIEWETAADLKSQLENRVKTSIEQKQFMYPKLIY